MDEQYWQSLDCTVVISTTPPPPLLKKKSLLKNWQKEKILQSLLQKIVSWIFYYLSIPDKWSIKSLAEMPVCDISEDSC